jgi:hypothetical protein
VLRTRVGQGDGADPMAVVGAHACCDVRIIEDDGSPD